MDQAEQSVSIDFLLDDWERDVRFAVVELAVREVVQHVDVHGVFVQRLRDCSERRQFVVLFQQ